MFYLFIGIIGKLKLKVAPLPGLFLADILPP
jgi:hypothetical protein